MACLPAYGDNSQALVSGLSAVQWDNHSVTILYNLHQCRPCTLQDILFKSLQGWYNYIVLSQKTI